MTFADMLTVEDAVWDSIYAVNVRAPMRIMRAVLPEMIKAGRGSVINIGSSWSSRASVSNHDGGGVDYCSSKAALQSLTRAAAQGAATASGTSSATWRMPPRSFVFLRWMVWSPLG